MEKHLQTDRYVMERCATNYFCTSDSGITLHLKLHCDEKQGLENVKYALYIMSHTVAVNIKMSLGCVWDLLTLMVGTQMILSLEGGDIRYEIWDSHSGVAEDSGLLGCDAELLHEW